MQISEGHIPFRGYRTWYRVVGDAEQPGKSPLLCLHGGPGSGHFYLEPLEALAETGRRVILYDQLGCGNSDVPEDLSTYTVSLYVDEVTAVRKALGLESLHILGHSWGGMLAMEYALTQPDGLRSLILSNTGSSMPQWMAEDAVLLRKAPREGAEDAQAARSRWDDRFAGIQAGGRGVLSSPRQPARPTAARMP